MAKKSTKKQYPLKMDDGLWQKIKNSAEDERRSVNAFILNAVEKYLYSDK